MRTALVTGSAGFIGYHTSLRLLTDGWRVIGLDSLSDYYDVTLKEARHARLAAFAGFTPVIDRVERPGCLMDLMATHQPELVIHLAAQAGVRHSIDAPRDYVEANLCGSFELLEAARAHPPSHMMLASTSSVYGANTKMPYAETDRTASPMSFYSATKMATEAMAHSYAHLYGIPTTMFRFFTVYGPWGRPDMALFKFVKAIRAGQPIDLYNHGDMRRDFTYVDDLVDGLVRLVPCVPAEAGRVAGDSLSPVAPWRVVNLGNGQPVPLLRFVEAIESALGVTATRNMMDMQPGDVPATWADCSLVEALIGGLPETPLSQGVAAFTRWYLDEWEPLRQS
ncbi:NAD-dependent epimerase/dehydratase family protein [Mesobacterium pallidum]|uniref:NAD-dependent epimerase/dehydratase family protein n=1 Tax=Mesobacterium pallidum TaxID=2872037 RepID=UPI001EE3846A|nr:NAD-dependent epimerase/dehydratase family protein [Mesobacterium pallidum]